MDDTQYFGTYHVISDGDQSRNQIRWEVRETVGIAVANPDALAEFRYTYQEPQQKTPPGILRELDGLTDNQRIIRDVLQDEFRRRMREDGFIRHILPPEYVTFAGVPINGYNNE